MLNDTHTHAHDMSTEHKIRLQKILSIAAVQNVDKIFVLFSE